MKQNSTPPQETSAPNPRPVWLIGLALFGACALFFWPILSWITDYTRQHEQLSNAFIIVVAAVVAIVFKESDRLRAEWRVSDKVVATLAAAFLLVGAAGVFKRPEFVLIGMLFAAAGLVLFVWGASARIMLRPALVGLGGFLVLLVLMPLLDWPLRTLAGVHSAEVLIRMGLTPGLALVETSPGVVELILALGNRLFIVAPECNGFGLIASGVLLALILAQVSDEPLWWRALTVPIALAIGFLLNVFRILSITLLAQRFPSKEAYDLIHEVAGVSALWGGLALIWWLSGFRIQVRKD
jgi:exosortase/archaeosortase family protein